MRLFDGGAVDSGPIMAWGDFVGATPEKPSFTDCAVLMKIIAQEAPAEPRLGAITSVSFDGDQLIVRVKPGTSEEERGFLQRLMPHVTIAGDQGGPVVPTVGSTQPCTPGSLVFCPETSSCASCGTVLFDPDGNPYVTSTGHFFGDNPSVSGDVRLFAPDVFPPHDWIPSTPPISRRLDCYFTS